MRRKLDGEIQNRDELERNVERLTGAVDGKNREIREYQVRMEEGENLARQFHQIRNDFKKITG